MKDILFELMNYHTKGADTYYNRGSMWLIFTNEKKWVIELTEKGVLWYNYYFFENFMKLLSMDVVENQDYITKWVEGFIEKGVEESNFDKNNIHLWVDDTIQNGVKRTTMLLTNQSSIVDDTIQNGVKRTQGGYTPESLLVGDTIQNGVIYTVADESEQHLEVGDTIQNGIKVTIDQWNQNRPSVKDVLENGIKHTEYGDWLDGDERLDDIIENGVKETKQEEHHRLREVVQTIKNGFKETNPHFLEIPNPINFEPTIKEMKRMNEVNIVLEGYQRGKRTS